MIRKKVRQRIKYLYKYNDNDIQIIQICVFNLDNNKISVRTLNEKRKPYTMSKSGKKKPLQEKAGWQSTCTILKNHAKNLKDDPERLSTKFLQNLIGVKCK